MEERYKAGVYTERPFSDPEWWIPVIRDTQHSDYFGSVHPKYFGAKSIIWMGQPLLCRDKALGNAKREADSMNTSDKK